MSSVGGAMDGRGGLALTRSLSDRLSVIALQSAFHGRPHKSSASTALGGKERSLGQHGRRFPPPPHAMGLGSRLFLARGAREPLLEQVPEGSETAFGLELLAVFLVRAALFFFGVALDAELR